MIKEKPILFNFEMVKAILEDRKTQTRRVIKFPKKHPHITATTIYFHKEDLMCGYSTGNPKDENTRLKCPYGKPGDRLWVRETWCPQINIFGQETDRTPFYKADDCRLPIAHKWKPSIFMPRWASRITLEITNVRIERVQEIDVKEIKTEGVRIHIARKRPRVTFKELDKLYIKHWIYLWNSINAKRGYEWDKNPWVWVVEFKEK